MPIVYLNTKVGFDHYTQQIIHNRWTVVNAPRPIPGAITWTGLFRHGIFYAAGPSAQFQSHWDCLDAWPCQLISNHEITEILRAKALALNKSLEIFLKRYPDGLKLLAAAFHLGSTDQVSLLLKLSSDRLITLTAWPNTRPL